MTRRQQLFLFVLGLTAISLCVTGVALTIDTVRRIDQAAPVVVAQAPPPEESPLPEAPLPTQNMAWSSPPASPTSTALPSPTHTLVPTWTPAATDTPTATSVPTDTPLPPTPTPRPQPASPPTPAPPTATPAPQFAYTGNYVAFDTGSPDMTRITGMVWNVIDVNTNQFDAKPDYQMKLVDPAGQEHMSDVSGLGGADSTCPRCGDNRRMNCKVEFAPYLPGTYRVTLLQAWDGAQAAAEVEFTLAAAPPQYVHIDFFPNR